MALFASPDGVFSLSSAAETLPLAFSMPSSAAENSSAPPLTIASAPLPATAEPQRFEKATLSPSQPSMTT